MRRLIVAYLQTLDGVHEAPRSWAGPYFGENAAQESLEQLEHTDAMLMGRTTYEYFAAAWPNDSGPYADRVNAVRKYVFSSTLTAADWTNSVILDGDPVPAVARLKSEGDGDLVIYGLGRLARTLLDHDLVDELKVLLFPVLQGGGAPVHPGPEPTRLRLASVSGSDTGAVALTYTRRRG